MRQSIVLFILFIFNLNFIHSNPDGRDSSFTFESPHMGTMFRITLYWDDPDFAREAADSAFQRVEELNAILSDYLPDSELQKVSNASGSGQRIPVSDELFEILKISQKVSRQTDGAFDITAGPFTHEWRDITRGLRTDVLRQDEIGELSKSVGFEHLSLDKNRKTVALKKPGMQLDPGGIGKGFAAKEIWKVMQHFGINSVLIDAGGDLLAGDPPPGRKYWVAALPGNDRRDEQSSLFLMVSGNAISTSGDLYQYVEINGVRYSHIVNPLTGWAMSQPTTATVIGKNAALTDAYATALNILPVREGIALINQMDGYEARVQILTKDNGPQTFYSDGFNDYVTSE